VKRSGVSRRTIYELFDGKEAIFRASHAWALAALRRDLHGTGPSRSARPDVAIAAMLNWAAAEPSQALLVPRGTTISLKNCLSCPSACFSHR
jgi:AcrR family transcriptional regulator